MNAEAAATRGEGVRTSLATLKDVAGIAGSFVCTASGRLIAREIPALFDDAVLAEAGSRLLRISETFAAGGDALEFAVVRYGENRLYLKTVAGGMLCIVVVGEVNMPALRMAANLVGRRIASAISQAETEPPPPVSPAPSPRPIPATPAGRRTSPAGAPASSSAPGRRFRGRSLD